MHYIGCQSQPSVCVYNMMLDSESHLKMARKLFIGQNIMLHLVHAREPYIMLKYMAGDVISTVNIFVVREYIINRIFYRKI